MLRFNDVHGFGRSKAIGLHDLKSHIIIVYKSRACKAGTYMLYLTELGVLAQLGACHTGSVEVTGSSPVYSIKQYIRGYCKIIKKLIILQYPLTFYPISNNISLLRNQPFQMTTGQKVCQSFKSAISPISGSHIPEASIKPSLLPDCSALVEPISPLS